MQPDIQIQQGFVETYSLWQKVLGNLWDINAQAYSEILHNKHYLSAYRNGEFTGVVIYDIDSVQQIASINLIMVDPAFQRQGIGTALVTAAKEQLKQIGVKKILLANCDKGGLWRALPKNLANVDTFFVKNGWALTSESLDQTGNIKNYKSPDFLNVRPRRQDVIFRFFQSEDREKLLSFQQQQFPHWRIYFEQSIEAKRFDNIVVVLMNDDIIGACLVEYPGQKFMGSNWVNMLGDACGSPSVLGVAEDYRGYGIGYYLFDYAMTVLSERGAKHAFINFSDAPNVYKRFGFNVIWEYKHGVCIL